MARDLKLAREACAQGGRARVGLRRHPPFLVSVATPAPIKRQSAKSARRKATKSGGRRRRPGGWVSARKTGGKMDARHTGRGRTRTCAMCLWSCAVESAAMALWSHAKTCTSDRSAETRSRAASSSVDLSASCALSSSFAACTSSISVL